MKRKQRRFVRRLLAFLLCLCMAAPMAGSLALAAPEDGLCEHHPAHTDECGYSEASEGTPCVHEHDENCGYTEAVEGSPCGHEHDESCGYAEAAEGTLCGHEHDESCGYSEAVEEIPCDMDCADEDGDGSIDHQDGCAYRPGQEGSPCSHEHDESCGYAEAAEGTPCVHEHDENCGYAEAAEGMPCGHEHDESCGYTAATEGSPCAFVCEICGQEGNDGNDAIPLDGDPQDETFSEGRSITYYARTADNELFGAVADYKESGISGSWNELFSDADTVYYSEKKISDSGEPYCSFQYKTEDVDWGGSSAQAHCLTKTYNSAVPDNEIVAEGYESTGIVMPFNGKGSSVTGKRFYAYNTKPDGSGDWYRCGQSLPEDVTALYANFIAPLSLASNIGQMAKDAEAGISLNGKTGTYTADAPYVIGVENGQLSEDALYYTAYLDMGEMASLYSWARTDKLDLDVEKTYVELTINFDPRLEIFPEDAGDDEEFTFQYTGGFTPWRDGRLLEPDEGTTCTYTVTVKKSEMPNNVLTLKFGLNATGYKAPDLTLKEFSEMTLTVSGQQGARAMIPEELAESAAEPGVTDPSDASFLKTDGKVFIRATPGDLSAFAKEVSIDIAPVYAQLQRRASGTLTLTAQDMTAYTGGDSISGDSFPTPRFLVQAPETMDLNDVSISVAGEEYGFPENTESGDIVPLSFLGESFTPVSGEGAAADDSVAGVYEIEIDTEALNVTASGAQVSVDYVPGKLTVRTVSAPGQVIGGTADIAQPVVADEASVNTANGLGAAVIPEGTRYFSNGAESLGVLGDNDSDAPQIALLFDDLLPGENGEDTLQLLIDRAQEQVPSIDRGNSSFKYLDLINENDGNIWVSTQDGSVITVYWPIPSGLDPEEYTFGLLHFKGLHREYRGDLAGQIQSAEVESIPVTVSGSNLKFTLQGNQKGGSFSPFAIYWTKREAPAQAVGNLAVSKTVTGSGAELDRAFSFTIELKDRSVNGTYGQTGFSEGKAVVSLKHGESVTISGLPAGAEYLVTENDGDGYRVTSSGAQGIVPENGTARADFRNEKISEGEGGEDGPGDDGEPDDGEPDDGNPDDGDSDDENQGDGDHGGDDGQNHGGGSNDGGDGQDGASTNDGGQGGGAAATVPTAPSAALPAAPDGAATSPIVPAADSSEPGVAPQTGDVAAPALWIALAGLSCAIFAIAFLVYRAKRPDHRRKRN